MARRIRRKQAWWIFGCWSPSGGRDALVVAPDRQSARRFHERVQRLPEGASRALRLERWPEELNVVTFDEPFLFGVDMTDPPIG